jgi:hypothetical protein
VFQRPKSSRKLSPRRLEQEAVLQQVVRSLDDRSMTLLVELAGAIQRTMSK